MGPRGSGADRIAWRWACGGNQRSFTIAAVGEQQGYLLAGEQQSRQDHYGDGPEAATRTGGNLTRSLAEERALPHYSGRERAAAFNGDAAQKRWGQSVLAGQRVCA